MGTVKPSVRFNGLAVLLARKRAGMTQEGLARELDVTTRTVQNWEQGLEPSAVNFLALSQLFDLPPDELYPVDEAAA